MSSLFNPVDFDFLNYALPSTVGIALNQDELGGDRSAMAELAEDYRKIGYDRGYAQATQDHLEALVATAESVLRSQPADQSSQQSTRQLLYSFVAKLHNRIGILANSSDADNGIDHQDTFVDGGLGI